MAADSLQKTAKAAAMPGHRRRLRAVGEKPPAIVIAGPTASGKSALALALAEALRGTIINADSQQLYRDLPILSARPDAAAEALAPHRLDAAERSRVPSARQTLAATAEMDLSHLAGTDQRCMLRYPVTMSGNHGLIRRAIPTRFDRRAEAGRNSPLLVAVETSDGIEHEVFLKASGQPELGVEGLANEAVAACLAGDLSLPINEPFLVELDPEWVASIPDTGTRSILEMSAGVAFGSKSAGEQWRIWSAADRISTGRRAHALAIFAFDAYIENDDRRSSNPNCLVKGEAFRIIDHETAFRIRLKLSPRPAPWKLGNLQRVVGPDGHLFASGLKGRDLDFAAIRAAWCGISDTRLQRYLTALPEEWFEANPAMQDAVTHLRNVRERIDDCLAELRRVLA